MELLSYHSYPVYSLCVPQVTSNPIFSQEVKFGKYYFFFPKQERLTKR